MGAFTTSGGAPSVDVGAIQSGAALTTTREKTEIFQGFPKTLIDQLCTQETAVLKFNSIEWNLGNLAKALGAGIFSDGSSEGILGTQSEAAVDRSMATLTQSEAVRAASVAKKAGGTSIAYLAASEAVLAASELILTTSEAVVNAGHLVGGTDILTFGGELSFAEVALRLTHSTPKGATITVDVYKAQGTGAIEMTFGDDVHNFPMEFNAMVPFDPCTKTVVDWSGNTLLPGAQLFRITIVNAPDPC